MTHDTVDRIENHAFQVNGMTFLPHYRNDSLFVGPGYPRHNKFVYTAHDLLLAGAIRINLMLWPRGKTGVVNQVNI